MPANANSYVLGLLSGVVDTTASIDVYPGAQQANRMSMRSSNGSLVAAPATASSPKYANSYGDGRTHLIWSSGPTTVSGVGTYTSPTIDLSPFSDVTLQTVVTGTPTGTSETMDVYLDVQDSSGNWILGTIHLTQFTTAAVSQSASAGMNTGSSSVMLPPAGRVRWVLAGTTPSYPGTTFSLYGR